jgi:hypothetical protein
MFHILLSSTRGCAHFGLSTHLLVFCKWGVMDDARVKRLVEPDTCYCACVTPVIPATHRCQPAMHRTSTPQGSDNMVVLYYVTERDIEFLAWWLLAWCNYLHSLVAQSKISELYWSVPAQNMDGLSNAENKLVGRKTGAVNISFPRKGRKFCYKFTFQLLKSHF